MLPDFQKAQLRITEIVMFENWLRFYFIAEEGDKLFIRIPEQAMAKLTSGYAHLAGLAERLNNKEIDHKTSMEAVVMFTATEADGNMPEALIGQVFDSTRFHLDLQLFGSWVQSHEEQLDAAFMEFSTWKAMFADWRKSDEVRKYADELSVAMHRTVRNAPDTTQ